MGLFSKKDPCAICGGKVKGLFPSKVEGQLICKDCYGNVHLPDDMVANLTLEQFKAYRVFRQENDVQRRQFQTTQQVDFGFFGDHILLDTNNRLFCMSTDLDSTIFEGKHVKSFVIREDQEPLFEGSAAGLICYHSTVTDRVIAMTPMIQRVAMMKEMRRQADRIAEEENRERRDSRVSNYDQEIPKPFEKFVVEIQCEHPYWTMLSASKEAPGFNASCPDANEYLQFYQDDVAIMEQLARALMQVAFPGAPERRVNAVGTGGQNVAVPVDAVVEIQRFKELMDQGVITEEEFAAKKRQLLGL